LRVALTLIRIIGSHVAEAALGLRFFSRLPVPRLPFEADPHRAPDIARLARVLPVVGAVLGGIGALVLLAALGAGLPERVAALLAIAAQVAATGAFHEDGLADTCDALGGTTRERRLEIMKDSRIGTFGGAGLVLALLLRVELVAVLAGADPAAAAGALVLAGAVSRASALLVPLFLPPARAEGAAFAAGRPQGVDVVLAFGMVLALAATLLPAGIAVTAFAGGVGVALVVAGFVVRLAARQFGGQTGDVAGACQQLCEIGFLAALLGLR
jgi:adenosylcobinamide-GDP ribazoletransferase